MPSTIRMQGCRDETDPVLAFVDQVFSRLPRPPGGFYALDDSMPPLWSARANERWGPPTRAGETPRTVVLDGRVDLQRTVDCGYGLVGTHGHIIVWTDLDTLGRTGWAPWRLRRRPVSILTAGGELTVGHWIKGQHSIVNDARVLFV